MLAAATANLCASGVAAQGKIHRGLVHPPPREQSGLFRPPAPAFEKKTGIKVRVVAVGTGRRSTRAAGDADVVFVHDKPAEEKFVAEGFGVKRYEVMYNDFILVGPEGRSGEDGG